VWKAVETSTREIGVGKVEGRRSERRGWNEEGVMNLFLKVGSKNNSCIRKTQENLIENSSTN